MGQQNINLISIVIPVFNSESTIGLVVDEIKNTLGKIDFELILVNDGSKDNSYKKCKKLSEKYNFIKFITLSRNFGQHNAIIAGLNFTKGDYVICMDDDLQTSPREIPKLIDAIEEGYDVVYADYKYNYHGFLRRVGRWMNAVMLRMLLKKPKELNVSSYFIIRRYLVDEILNYKGPYPYMGGLILRSTDNIGMVEVNHEKREYGKSGYSFINLFRLWFNGFTNFSVKPLRISFFLGMILSAIGFLFAIWILVRKLIEPQVVLGWTSIIIAILVFSGVQLVSVGLIGEYIGRIFLTQNNQPQYIVKEKYNINK